jgi:hypothetical protein
MIRSGPEEDGGMAKVKVAKMAAADDTRERVVVQLERGQVQQLLDEAERRRKESGARRLNLSELVREAVSAWLAKRR